MILARKYPAATSNSRTSWPFLSCSSSSLMSTFPSIFEFFFEERGVFDRIFVYILIKTHSANLQQMRGCVTDFCSIKIFSLWIYEKENLNNLFDVRWTLARLEFIPRRILQTATCLDVVNHMQGPGNRGGRGGPGPPRIEHLESKIFENSQNDIFLIIRAPPRLNLFLRPCLCIS